MTTVKLAGRPCPDCGVMPGEQHDDGCDVEVCPDCGGQLISCDCKGVLTMPRLPWTGEWPGKMECREFGWYSKLVPGKGWQSCSKNDPGAIEDLNRLAQDAVWSKDQGRFVLRPGIEVSLDGGITWRYAPEGVRIVYRGIPVGGEEERGEVHINATHEALITDIWVSREEHLDHNIGTDSIGIDDIVARLIDEGA